MNGGPDVDFWLDEPECVVVRDQPGVAVYTNPHGEVVVRQRSRDSDDYDPFVYIRPEHVEAVAKAMLREAGIDPDPPREMLALPAPDRRTPAARPRPTRAREPEPALDLVGGGRQ